MGVLQGAPKKYSCNPSSDASQPFFLPQRLRGRAVGEAVDLIGDGVVDADSSRSAWTTDVVPVRALHRSMITRVPCPIRGDAEPPAIEIILDRLARDQDMPR